MKDKFARKINIEKQFKMDKQKEIIEGSKLLADYLGFKLGYYEWTHDVSSGDDLNYIWHTDKVPILYKDGITYDKSIFKEALPLEDYKELLDFYHNYNNLFQVIEKLEKEDLKDYLYQWEEDGEIRYNFEGIVIDRFGRNWDAHIKLALDPDYPLSPWERYNHLPDKEQLFFILRDAVRKVKEIKNG